MGGGGSVTDMTYKCYACIGRSEVIREHSRTGGKAIGVTKKRCNMVAIAALLSTMSISVGVVIDFVLLGEATRFCGRFPPSDFACYMPTKAILVFCLLSSCCQADTACIPSAAQEPQCGRRALLA